MRAIIFVKERQRQGTPFVICGANRRQTYKPLVPRAGFIDEVFIFSEPRVGGKSGHLAVGQDLFQTVTAVKKLRIVLPKKVEIPSNDLGIHFLH